MSYAVLADVVTMGFCSAVLVQSVRMMRSLQTVKDGALTQVVDALDKATVQARAVLGDLKQTLQTDCVAHARAVAEGREMAEELTVMIGIANASAERIMEAARDANRTPCDVDHAAVELAA